MKFEIDPNELTTEQRAHVSAFITNWPSCGNQLFTGVTNDLPIPRNAHSIKEDAHGFRFTIPNGEGLLKRAEPFEQHAAVKYEHVTEEQRLDAEQKSESADIPEVNLNAIFGTPDVAKGASPLIPDILSNTVPLDKEGLPWDSRIHASTKTFIADGSWKLRRGVDPAEVATVKAQLKELMAVPKFTDLTSELMNVAFNTPNADNEVDQALVDAARVPVPPTPEGIEWGLKSDGIPKNYSPVPAPKSHYLIDQDPTVDANQQPTVTLTDLIGRMSKAIAENRLTQANVTEICVKHGVSEFHLLSNRPDLLPLIDADMKAIGV